MEQSGDGRRFEWAKGWAVAAEGSGTGTTIGPDMEYPTDDAANRAGKW